MGEAEPCHELVVGEVPDNGLLYFGRGRVVWNRGGLNRQYGRLNRRLSFPDRSDTADDFHHADVIRVVVGALAGEMVVEDDNVFHLRLAVELPAYHFSKIAEAGGLPADEAFIVSIAGEYDTEGEGLDGAVAAVVVELDGVKLVDGGADGGALFLTGEADFEHLFEGGQCDTCLSASVYGREMNGDLSIFSF